VFDVFGVILISVGADTNTPRTRSQVVWNGVWPMTITPLDTCDWSLKGDRWNRLLAINGTTDHPKLTALLESFCYWSDANRRNCTKESDILYDPTATVMAFNATMLDMTMLPMAVDNAGDTNVVTQGGKQVEVALNWRPGGNDAMSELIVQAMVQFDSV
jgi:inosine-uridine nucleoside N-ribohydrolase